MPRREEQQVGSDEESPVSEDDSLDDDGQTPRWSLQRDVDDIIARWRAEHP